MNNWLLLQDVIGPADTWPAGMRRKFWVSPLDYRDRLYFAALGFGNGISPQLMCDVLAEVNPNCTASKLRKISDLYKYWGVRGVEGQRRRSRYFTYDFILGYMVTLSGERYHLRRR